VRPHAALRELAGHLRIRLHPARGAAARRGAFAPGESHAPRKISFCGKPDPEGPAPERQVLAMTGASRAANLTIGLLLFAVLAASVRLWWPPSDFLLVMPSDDTQLMAVDRAVLAGYWSRLLTPQDVHVYPLFRLIRLYFELHFLERYAWLQSVAIAAHLASVILLFLLCRRFFHSSWAALLAALLFAWHALGRVAFLRKADEPYILSLPFLLLAVYCLQRLRTSPQPAWAAGCLLCLLAAIGLHSMGAMLAIPGVLLAYYAPRPQGPDAKLGARRCRIAAWLACLLPALAGACLWAAAWPPLARSRPAGHRPIPHNLGDFFTWLLDASRGTLWHFAFLARRTHPTPAAVAIAGIAFAAVLVAVRRQPSFRWILTVAALAIPPVFVTLFVRSSNDYGTSRYFYQSSLLAAVAAAAAFDLLLAALAQRPALRLSAIAIILAAAPFYFMSQEKLVEKTVRELQSGPASTREFWAAWAGFFNRAAAGRGSPPFRLPHVLLGSSIYLDEVFNMCNPRGKAGILVLPAARTHAADCMAFWERAKQYGAGSLSVHSGAWTPSMLVAGFPQAAPETGAWVCNAWADEGPSQPRMLH